MPDLYPFVGPKGLMAMIGVMQKDWLQLFDVKGFKHHRVSAEVRNIDGAPRVISLHVDIADVADPVALSNNQLRGLNLRAIARTATVIADAHLHAELQDSMRRISVKGPSKGRQVVNVEQVAEIWNRSHQAGIRAPRSEVVKALDIHERTASRYIKKAREAKLIPAVWR